MTYQKKEAMAANTNYSVTTLDPDLNKAAFIAWLVSQPQFKDYSFTGSNINTLLDIFSFNTFYNAFLINMASAESWLDSCVLMDSAISHAKHLNYVPRSYRSSSALIDIAVTVTGNSFPSTIVIPQGYAFTTRMNNNVYTFTTPEALTVGASSGSVAGNVAVYQFSNVAIYEGTYVTESFAVSTANATQRFILTNPDIDTTSLQVYVQQSNTNSSNSEYIAVTNMLGLSGNSQVYFVEAEANSQYAILFGDGIIGQNLSLGNIVNATYRVSSGTDPNGADTFTSATGLIGGYSSFTITTDSVADGGAINEDLDSIKYNAPRHYETQDRAITDDDYNSILRETYPQIRDINVYGGQTVTPPQFGRVFIAIDLQGETGISSAESDAIVAFVKTKNSPFITPVIIEPDYTYLVVTSNITYDIKATTQSTADIKTDVLDAIGAYNNTNLIVFQSNFRGSQFTAAIDNADPSITGQNTTIQLYRTITPPSLNVNNGYSINFQNPVIPSTVTSDTFTYGSVQATLVDDSNGNINVISTNNGVTSTLAKSVGSIVYSTGVITISALNIAAYSGTGVDIYVTPLLQDIVTMNNTILEIDLTKANINVTASYS